MRRLLLALLVGFSCKAYSQDGWDWRAETNAKVELYDTHGDAAGSPYPFSGTHSTLGLSLDAERRPNPFDFTRFQFTGTQSESRYYSQENGFFPERINLTQQSGTAAIPYQAQAGDYFGVFSFRTLQTSLRGGLLELQPKTGQSLMLLSGAAGQNYREFQWRDNNFNGASYLYEQRDLGRFAVNWVNNMRQGDATLGTAGRRQNVWSGAAELPFTLPGQGLRLETEVARFSGDHDAGQDRQDTGFFSELSWGRGGGNPPRASCRLAARENSRRSTGGCAMSSTERTTGRRARSSRRTGSRAKGLPAGALPPVRRCASGCRLSATAGIRGISRRRILKA
jgi:hypothetical protein